MDDVKNFEANQEYDGEMIVLKDRREISILKEEIEKERDFTLTYENDDGDEETQLIIASPLLPKLKSGELRLFGLKGDDE